MDIEFKLLNHNKEKPEQNLLSNKSNEESNDVNDNEIEYADILKNKNLLNESNEIREE